MIRDMEMTITGKNDRPPSRGTGVSCIFRSSGMSYSWCLCEISRMRGMMTQAMRADIRNAAMMNMYAAGTTYKLKIKN